MLKFLLLLKEEVSTFKTLNAVIYQGKTDIIFFN